MRNSNHFERSELKLIETIIDNIEEQFEKRPPYFSEIPYTISLKQLQEKTKTNPKSSTHIVKRFLKLEGKTSRHKSSGLAGTKYQITISRNELEKWKKDLENLKEKNVYVNL